MPPIVAPTPPIVDGDVPSDPCLPTNGSVVPSPSSSAHAPIHWGTHPLKILIPVILL